MGTALDAFVYSPPLSVSSQRYYQSFDWTRLSSSADFASYNALYSTFIPVYFKIRWVPNIQSNASGYYLPGGANNAPITYNLTDGFSTTRYDNVDNPIGGVEGTQYTSFKTFDPSKRWRTIVYPRRSQMTAPRQQFDAYIGNPPVNDTIRGMGRLWVQGVIQWEDSNNNMLVEPPTLSPPIAEQNARLSQLGNFFLFFYLRVYDRK